MAEVELDGQGETRADGADGTADASDAQAETGFLAESYLEIFTIQCVREPMHIHFRIFQ